MFLYFTSQETQAMVMNMLIKSIVDFIILINPMTH